MTNEVNLDCMDIAKALKNLMTYANFTGFINQPKDGKLLQFSAFEATCAGSSASMEIEIGENIFTVVISRH